MNIAGQIPLEQKAAYLRTLPAVRQRCSLVFDLATQGKLQYFDYHPEKVVDAASFCIGLMKRDFGSNFALIHPHGRWRHFDSGRERISPLLAQWSELPDVERCKRLLDLFVVSVLLDAGAGKDWHYREFTSQESYNRSEGLAIASLQMFSDGMFSSDNSQPFRVDAHGLSTITVSAIGKGMQVSESNPMDGLEGRSSLLIKLAEALKARPDFFGEEGRPGNLIDFLQTESKAEGSVRRVPLAALWTVLIDGLNPIWPNRLSLGGVSLGDVWSCPAIQATEEGDDLVPFHKLTQWLTYSLMETIKETLKWEFDDTDDMTGLPEYRNGGLFMDTGVLTLKENALPIDSKTGLPRAAATHPAIVEWRAMTVMLLDKIADSIRNTLGLTAAQLSLAQVLEAATWKGGRELAKRLRPATGGPPIDLESDGTVF